MNSGNELGFSWLQSTIKNGTRSSSATSYLGPEFIKRPNLSVLLHARVTRVLQSGNKSEKGRRAFSGVEVTQDGGGKCNLTVLLIFLIPLL
jgi:choline dehydrogenase-like flavoprotein